MEKKTGESYHPYAMTTILFWSLAYVWTKLALGHFTPFPLGFLRYAVASLCLLALCAAKRIPPPRLRDVPWFLASGATGFFLYMMAFNTGAGYTNGATTSVIIAIAPVLTALLATVFFREALQPQQWAAIAVEFAGILVLTVYGGVLALNVGIWWLLLAAVLLSTYNLLQRRLTRTYTALQSTAYSIFAGTLLLAVFLPASIGEVRTATPAQLGDVALLGMLSSALAYLFWSKAFERAERTTQVTNYMFFTPFVTGIFGFLMLGEVPEPSTWVGGALIVGGAVLFNRSAARPAPVKG